MSKVVVIGDAITLSKLLNANEWSMVQRLGLDLKVFNWVKLSTELQASCMQYGIKSVSLTDTEVEELFNMYQQETVHSFGIELYGALLYAFRHETLFASYEIQTNKLCINYDMFHWLIDNKKCILPIYLVNEFYNFKTIAV